MTHPKHIAVRWPALVEIAPSAHYEFRSEEYVRAAHEGLGMTNGSFDQVIARSHQEVDEPSIVARTLEPLTRALLVDAGVRPGMKVLDVYSGAGDLAFLAREIVGPDGDVTGFDDSPDLIAYATERAAFRGLENVKFVQRQVSDLSFGAEFDAIVGRVVLMYRRDPAADLRALVRCLQPGGLVIFQEFDLLPGKTVPPAILVDKVRSWLLEALASAGIEVEMGPKLYSAYVGAGLAPEMRVDGFIGGAASVVPEFIAGAARMLIPHLETLGLTKEKIQIETLEDRMREDLVQTGGVMLGPLLIGAWARVAG